MAVVHKQASIEDLYRIDQKAELVNGDIVLMSPTGGMPGYAGDEIFFSLRSYSLNMGTGIAVGDNKGFRVSLPHRGSFSPDAAWYVGPDPGMKFFEGAPLFAAEVRSEGDYGLQAEDRMAVKRADYFAAGTLVVWDVDLLGDVTIRKYSSENPLNPA